MAAVSRGTEVTIKAVAISQTKCAGDIFKDCIKNEFGNDSNKSKFDSGGNQEEIEFW
jgi:hypothetical protein